MPATLNLKPESQVQRGLLGKEPLGGINSGGAIQNPVDLTQKAAQIPIHRVPQPTVAQPFSPMQRQGEPSKHRRRPRPSSRTASASKQELLTTETMKVQLSTVKSSLGKHLCGHISHSNVPLMSTLFQNISMQDTLLKVKLKHWRGDAQELVDLLQKVNTVKYITNWRQLLTFHVFSAIPNVVLRHSTRLRPSVCFRMFPVSQAPFQTHIG